MANKERRCRSPKGEYGHPRHHNMENVKETVCSYENLYKAMLKCRRNVMWKDSVAGYIKNGLVNISKLRESLINGTYDIDKYTVFYIHEPKERRIVSTRIKDRVFQRSLCDNYLTQQVSKSFVYDNCACQEGKGTDFARNRLKCHLQRFHRKSSEGYALKCDIHDYFGSTRHDVAIAAMTKRIDDEWALAEVRRIIESFDEGIGLGSQVSQLIELAVLDDLDHYIKERLQIRHYVRYMDDFVLIHESKTHLEYCRREIERKLTELGLELNAKKTQIFPLTQPIKFLGFSFRLTDTGRVVMRLLPDKLKHERRKLRRQVERAKRGLMTKEEVDACLISWIAHAQHGDTYRLIQQMINFYERLWC